MPRNPTTGVFTRVSNSFSEPVFGTVIDPDAAIDLFDDYDSGLTSAIPKEPTSAAGGGTINVVAGTATVAITGSALTATTVNLPTTTAQDGAFLSIVDWSDSITEHTITIVPNGSETVMKAASWVIVSTADNRASLTLMPSTSLTGWMISP